MLHIYAKTDFDAVWADLEAQEKLNQEALPGFRLWSEQWLAFKAGEGPDPGARPRMAWPMIYYGMNTCWWGHDSDHLGFLPTPFSGSLGGLPCDPRGGVLLQTENWRHWLSASRAKHQAESRFGLARLMAAHHTNSFLNTGMRWCEPSWDRYDEALERTAETIVAQLRVAHQELVC